MQRWEIRNFLRGGKWLLHFILEGIVGVLSNLLSELQSRIISHVESKYQILYVRPTITSRSVPSGRRLLGPAAYGLALLALSIPASGAHSLLHTIVVDLPC